MSVLVGRWRTDAEPGEDLQIQTDPAAGINAWAAAHPSIGVYEVDRTYPGPRILKFDEHLDRFEASARREGLPLDVDRDRFRSVLRELTGRTLAPSFRPEDGEGAAALGGKPPGTEIGSGELPGDLSVRFFVRAPQARPGEIEIVLEPFRPPSRQLYERGVFCATMVGAKREHPEAKTSGWMSDREAYVLPQGAYEGLLLSEDDAILEGATSNFYAVLDGRLWTADRDILYGIARQIVLAVAPGILPVRLDPIQRADLGRISEAFLTSSSRAVVPISRIDERELGPRGPVTTRISEAYGVWVEANLAPL